MKPNDVDQPANPMSTEQARNQVVEPAKQIARLAALQDAYAAFSFSSCNDQGAAPYRGVVRLNFTVTAGEKVDGYFDRIAATMVANGWIDGPPAGYASYGRVIHTAGVVGVMAPGPAEGWANVELSGECRNMDDHAGDGGFDWKKFPLDQ
ncbi:hypothetical protein TUM20985_49260 [Mycobacterium antarcticum]|uniref:hypothetical protein n=1 Tax=unclassified Mycolicibacterium TaxID=2636767 RepID=UPI00239962CB|nr:MULTISPECIES: hypothetical protein [unclassified Mycolicibacterium]BDX34379.1 hypothetical protein TUM20985_49260 [Mycolicibacterium sp. TUM20985]GLP77586.1 hypothetical protein TUM20983_46960 [Mycolicibacterium sp. TUM20983]